MQTPVYNRQISRIHIVLSIWPFSLILFVALININLFGLPLSELSAEKGFLGFFIYLLIKSWLLTMPIWLICSLYMLTQKERNTPEVFYWSILGMAGHLINSLLVF